MRDNPTLSMINDSDEEVLFEGSDTEELLSISGPDPMEPKPKQHQPNSLAMPSLLIDTRTDEESD